MSTEHPEGPYVEVNLTPSGGQSSDWQHEVARIRIRAHGTERDPMDRQVEVLPDAVRTKMAKHLGAALTERLLTTDFLPQIDWGKYRQHCNGGANFEDIRLDADHAA